MKVWALAFRYLWSRPLAAVLNLLLLTLGLATITVLLLTRAQVDRAFDRDLAGIDLVVGAKGSPLQLILAGVFHLDVPPGNIPLSEVRTLEQQKLVAQVIPLSLGDSFRGFRVVGTSAAYADHYQAQWASGGPWRKPMEVTLGAQVASRLGLTLGARFVGSHGLGEGGHQHEQHPFEVTGVLQPCACVLDRLILTDTRSVWQVHDQALTGDTPLDAQDLAALEEDREVTIALVRYRTPLAAVSLPRWVNSQTSMQAAAPAVEITRLLRMVGVGAEVLRAFALVLLLSAAVSVFVALWSAVRERQGDLAMLRMLGAPPRRLAALLCCEAWWLALLASAVGLALGHVLTGLIGLMLQAQQSLALTGWLWEPWEWVVPATALAVATVAVFLPMWHVYRLDPMRLLNER